MALSPASLVGVLALTGAVTFNRVTVNPATGVSNVELITPTAAPTPLEQLANTLTALATLTGAATVGTFGITRAGVPTVTITIPAV